MEPRKRRSQEQEVVLRDGRDEMNLVEFPLAAISDRLPPDTKTLVIESKTSDGVLRRLTISGSSAYGLPTAKDDEVLVALIQLAKLQGFESPKVAFSRYQVIQVLGWPVKGQSYERVDLAVNRWVGVTYYWENSWWDKKAQSWVDEKFGILDNAELYDREKWSRRAKGGQVPLPLSWVKWNEVVFRNFRAGYIKYLDMDVYRALKLPLAKRLYRYLDKHFYRRTSLRFDIQRLAREKLGLFGSYDNANLRRILEPAILELEQCWDLKPAARPARFVSRRRGTWEVVFEKRTKRSEADSAACREEEPVPTGLEAELLSRGVTGKVAKELCSEYPSERVSEKIELHDWHLSKKDKRIGENPAGFLIAAIRENYALPQGFETSAQREARKQEVARRKAAALAEKQAEEAKRSQASEERERPLRAYWESLLPGEQAALEEQALAWADQFRRKRFEDAKRSGGGELLSMYRELIVFDYIERVVLNRLSEEKSLSGS